MQQYVLRCAEYINSKEVQSDIIAVRVFSNLEDILIYH